MIVADANLIAYLLIEGTFTPAARAVYERDSVWVVPPLWRSEFLNTLATSIRAGVLTQRGACALWDSGISMLEGAECEPDAEDVLRLTTHRRVSAYDAQYVVLARMLETVLVTGDRKLARLYPEHVVLIDDFLAQRPKSKA
jgi:predicted nucleic acid-binding protein